VSPAATEAVVGPATLEGLTRAIHRHLLDAFRGEARAGAAGLDARLIVAAASGIEAARLPRVGDRPAGAEAVATAWAMARQRAAGMPTARLIGRKEFWSLELELSPAVLVPRPDTETLVAAALDWLDAAGRRGEALRVLDLGTGGGAILLALLSELPQASGIGVDLIPAALATARRNALALGLGARAGFVAADWMAPLAGRFDLVTANPPYIGSDAIAGLEDDVRLHDPHIALDGGADGLACYRLILAELPRLMAAGSVVFLEVGSGQAATVAAMLGAAGLATRRHRDLAGIERVVEGRFPA
jgi:release factor glutamine methyltransferase